MPTGRISPSVCRLGSKPSALASCAADSMKKSRYLNSASEPRLPTKLTSNQARGFGDERMRSAAT